MPAKRNHYDYHYIISINGEEPIYMAEGGKDHCLVLGEDIEFKVRMERSIKTMNDYQRHWALNHCSTMAIMRHLANKKWPSVLPFHDLDLRDHNIKIRLVPYSQWKKSQAYECDSRYLHLRNI